MTPSATDSNDIHMDRSASNNTSDLMAFFKNAQRLSNSPLEITLQRRGGPNVLPFVHVMLVFVYHTSRHPGAMSIPQDEFPWELLTTILNALLEVHGTRSHSHVPFA
jgi:hypothetical protein